MFKQNWLKFSLLYSFTSPFFFFFLDVVLRHSAKAIFKCLNGAAAKSHHDSEAQSLTSRQTMLQISERERERHSDGVIYFL